MPKDDKDQQSSAQRLYRLPEERDPRLFDEILTKRDLREAAWSKWLHWATLGVFACMCVSFFQRSKVGGWVATTISLVAAVVLWFNLLRARRSAFGAHARMLAKLEVRAQETEDERNEGFRGHVVAAQSDWFLEREQQIRDRYEPPFTRSNGVAVLDEQGSEALRAYIREPIILLNMSLKAQQSQLMAVAKPEPRPSGNPAYSRRAEFLRSRVEEYTTQTHAVRLDMHLEKEFIAQLFRDFHTLTEETDADASLTA
jgi:hypothetical protein